MPEQPSIEAKYRELKRRDPGCILLFREGAFYRAYRADADAIKALLADWQFPLWTSPDTAAFGAGRLEEVLAAIAAAGRRAAVVERRAGPAPRGAEVERVVTPGEADDEFTLRERARTEGEGGGR